MVSCALPILLAVTLAIPLAAFGQTYDTPSTLVVVSSHPNYLYTDPDGYSVITGMVHNESTNSYVGNVQMMAKFYGTGMEPLHVATTGAHLKVIPPGASSPFVIKSPSADPQIQWASASLLIFDPANPKQTGLDIVDTYVHDGSVHLNITDIIMAPHTDIMVHVAYHDSFMPPRILAVETYTVGDMGINGTASLITNGTIPVHARGYMVFAESHVFSAQWRSGPLPLPGTGPAPTHMEAWISQNDTPTDTVSGDYLVHASIDPPHTGGQWLHWQIKHLENTTVAHQDSILVEPGAGTISIQGVALEPGKYVIEMYLQDDSGISVAELDDPLVFTVE